MTTPMTPIEKFRLCAFWGFRILLVVTMFFAILHHRWHEAGLLVFIIFMTFLPNILEEQTGIDYPGELELIMLFFIIGSLYLGEMHAYYDKFDWWDILLHSISSIVIGGIGFSIVFVLNKSKKLAFKLSPEFVSLFAFCFAVALGTLWEIFEFAMDQIFGMNMQRSGLMDTMWDLIVDCGGALLFAVVGYFHIKRKITVFQWFERKFFKLNPELKKT